MILTDNHLYIFSIYMIKLNHEFYNEIKNAYLSESEAFYRFKMEEIKGLSPVFFYPRLYNLALFEDAIATKCLLWNLTDPSDKLAIKSLFIKELVEPYTEILLSHSEGLTWALSNKKYEVKI